MGQKINPLSFRTGITKNWSARWFIKGSFASLLEEDERIRNIIRKRVGQAGIAHIDIERTSNNLRVTIKAARPGFIIGRGGKGIEDLTKAVDRTLKIGKAEGRTVLSLNVEELKRSEISAPYMAQQIGWDLEKRLPFRRTIKKYIEQAMQSRDVKGAKVLLSGRLDGAEIARREWLRKGEMPLQTLRADIDYGQGTAFTTYGTVGIKVWIYRGEVFRERKHT